MSYTRLLGLQHGPRSITLVRHGQSVGNLADESAQEQGANRLELTARDADVELSDTGEEQAGALARWIAQAPADDRPTVVLTSPYRRAFDTARLAFADTGLEVVPDERLRERDLGVFDGLTGRGIRSEYASEAERRKKVGKFYYQPPSGESWADVVLRVRSLLADLRQGYDDERVWMFSHQAVIMAVRYVLEGLTEAELMDIDRSARIANVSLTSYERQDGAIKLVSFNDTGIVDASRADVTREQPVGEKVQQPNA